MERDVWFIVWLWLWLLWIDVIAVAGSMMLSMWFRPMVLEKAQLPAWAFYLGAAVVLLVAGGILYTRRSNPDLAYGLSVAMQVAVLLIWVIAMVAYVLAHKFTWTAALTSLFTPALWGSILWYFRKHKDVVKAELGQPMHR